MSKKRKRINPAIIEFSASLIEEYDIENFIGLLEKVESSEKEGLKLTIIIPFRKEYAELMKEVIEKCVKRYHDGTNLVIIPSRRWSSCLIKEHPEIVEDIAKGVMLYEEEEEPEYIA